MHHGFGAGFFVFAILRAVIELGLLILIVVLCVWAVRRFSSGRRLLLHQLDPAERLLRRRYAAGEVSREEYLGRMADLRGETAPPPAPSPQESRGQQTGSSPESPTQS